MQFENSQILFLAPVLMVLVWVLLRQRTYLGFSNAELLKGTITLNLNLAQKILLCAVVTLVVLALAGPYREFVESVVDTREARDLVLLLDKSGSMKGVNKIEAAKYVAKEFVENRSEDRLALISFDGTPQLEWPLSFAEETSGTHDHILRRLIALEASGATDIPRALLFALEILEVGGESEGKAIILVSDGISTIDTEEHETIVPKAVALNAVVYWIWIRESETTASESLSHYMNDQVKSVKKLTEAVEGKVFTTRVDDLASVFEEVDVLQTSPVTFKEEVSRTYHFQPFLLGALAFLALAILVELVKEV